MTEVVWTVASDVLTGTERGRLEPYDDGWRLIGVVVAVFQGAPIDVRYEVVVDRDWVTRTVEVTVDQLTRPRRLRLVRDDDGGWAVDGAAATELDGCVDVDLGVTPSTNTLPIRRLGLAVGDQADVDVAWVRFPELRVDRGRQTYTRLGTEEWRYRSGSFSAVLTVDADGLVVCYGDELWQRVDT